MTFFYLFCMHFILQLTAKTHFIFNSFYLSSFFCLFAFFTTKAPCLSFLKTLYLSNDYFKKGVSFLKGTKERVLQLLKHSNTILSGETIAQQLHVSRTAIWKAIRELERIGYKIEHLANGYRFIQSNLLEAEEIAFAHLPAQQIFIAKETESTMKLAKIAAMDQQVAPALFLAETQTGGHGRFARPFFSPPGQIYMTLLLKANQSFAELPQYTILAAVAVALAIDEATGKTCRIKWVNDIYLDDKKIVGILAEAGSYGLVLGMGINFQISEFPDEIAKRAGSLYSKGEVTEVSPTELVSEIWAQFQLLKSQDYLTIYKEHCFILGKEVTFLEGGEKFEGLAQDLTDSGELLIRLSDGRTKILNSGEISLKSWK